MKKKELRDLIKEELLNEVSKAKLTKELKAARKFAEGGEVENEFLDEIEANMDNWWWLEGIFIVYGDIHLAVGSDLNIDSLQEILPLMKKYRMTLRSIYSGVNLPHSGMMLRLFYT